MKQISRRWIYWSFVSMFWCSISGTTTFFSSKRYKWKRSQRSRKRIYGYKFLIQLHPLNHIEITDYFNYERRLNGAFSRNNLPRIKDGAYVINLVDKNDKRTHWVSLFTVRNTAVYFDSFGVECIPQEVLNKIYPLFLKITRITRYVFRIQDTEFIMCGFYCTAFI